MGINAEEVFSFHLANHEIIITNSVITQWVVIAFIMILTLVVTRNLKKIPDKTQSVVEIIVDMIKGLVITNMGERYKNFVPFIGTLGVFLFFSNLTGLVGFEPSTKDINVTVGLALISFTVMQGNAIKKGGFGGYLKGYLQPFAPMIFMNILEKFTLPLSLALRLFCNMLIGALILGLIYDGLGHFAFLIPVPIHAFFDLFDGLIQMFVFMMITMVYTRLTAEHSAHTEH